MRIRLLFELRLQSRQPKIIDGFTSEMTTQTLATAEIEKWLRIRVQFFKHLWLWIRNKNTESCRIRLQHSGSVTTSGSRVENIPGLKKNNPAGFLDLKKNVFVSLRNKILFFFEENVKNSPNCFYCIMQYHHFQNHTIITCYTYYDIQNWG